jgi:hypothetical protein
MQYNDNKDDVIPMAVATAIPQGHTTATPTSKRTLLQQGRSQRVLMGVGSTKQLSGNETESLKDQGFTTGLISSIARSNMTFPLRIWVVDNSGSMMTGDGHRIVQTGNANDVRFVSCSRWAEIQETVEYHAQIAALLGNPTVFRLLNDPGRLAGPQQFSVGERGPDFIAEELNTALTTIKNVQPSGVTPLSEHVREIRANVIAMKDDLSQMGQKVVIVLATDGLPSNEQGVSSSHTRMEFQNALRSLEGLPIWIVVRLCTDEDQVVEFYNNLDSELELSLEVIDDFVGEAEEIYEHNKWLNYALPLHRIREMGFNHKLFDLLDERPLTKDELLEFFALIFGEFDGIPDPQINWKGFCDYISMVVDKEKNQWNPIKKKMMPWINMRQLSKTYGDPTCTIM